MKKAKKVLLLALCAVLLVGATIAGTVAYLTANDSVTNTFTVGKVAITLQEHDVNTQTGLKTSSVVDGLENLELVPGREIQKNPFITVDSSSETCYLFVHIQNNVDEVVTIGAMEGWTAMGQGYYCYNASVDAGTVVTVFESVTCKSDADLSKVVDTKDSIVITAYAVQAETFANAQAAWNATFGANS